MSSVQYALVPVVYPGFGAAALVVEWDKHKGHLLTMQYETGRSTVAVEWTKRYRTLSKALAALSREVAKIERGG